MARKTTLRGTRTKLTAPMADLGSVIRFDLINNNTLSFSFVLDKVLQLEEAPVTNPIVHSFTSIYIPNPFKVFHNNLVSVKIGNNIFTYIVVNPSHPTSFSSREFSKQSLAGASAFSLKLGTQIFKFPFNLFDFSRIIKPSVGSDSKVIYSEVNTQNNVLRTTVLLNGSNLFRECEQEETSTPLIHTKQTFCNFPSEIFLIAFWDIKLKFLSTIKQPQDKSISFEVSTSREVIPDRSSLDDWLGFSFLNHTTSLAHTSNSYLRWEFETFSDSMIDSIMEFEIVDDFMFPSIVDTELQSFSISLDSMDYLFSWFNSNFSSSSCSHIREEYFTIYKHYGGEGLIPPTTKVVGILSPIL